MRANRLFRWRSVSPREQVKPENGFEDHAGDDQRGGCALQAKRIADDGGNEAQDEDQMASHGDISGRNHTVRGGG